ncbi:MAG: DUF1844 domain-containing protein [Nitrospirota bacterium]
MSAQEGEGFVVRDRRSRSEEGGAPSAGQTSAADSARQAQPDPSAFSQEAAHQHEPGPPVTFSSFVFSLGTSALMLMGEQLDPRQERLPVNLTQAKEIIDILSVLEGKTKGNLTSEEQAVLAEMLYALRMKYVSLASPSAGSGVR